MRIAQLAVQRAAGFSSYCIATVQPHMTGVAGMSLTLQCAVQGAALAASKILGLVP